MPQVVWQLAPWVGVTWMHRRGRDGCSVVAAIAVRDEMEEKKENLSKCFVEPSG